MEERNRLIGGITIGDYNGVGPEIILEVFEDERMFQFFTPVVYGSKSILSFYAKQMKIQPVFNELKPGEKLNLKAINVVNCWTEHAPVEPGQATDEAGARSLIALNTALADLKAGKIELLVTGPVNKKTISVHHPDFKGQTEYLAAYLEENDPLMMMVSDQLRVALATNHLPIKEVAAKLDMPGVLKKIELLNESLRKDFHLTNPKIAVLGLNPHAGDNELLGKEEKEIIGPAVVRAREKGISVLGPFAADGFFGAAHYRKFDGILAMYHDQGLIPFKAIAGSEGVNYTACLSKVRTSPDHGTAYDIAGKNLADAQSMRQAIFTAREVLMARKEYEQMRANPVERVRVSGEDGR